MTINIESTGGGGKSSPQAPPRPVEKARIFAWSTSFYNWARKTRIHPGAGLRATQTDAGTILSVMPQPPDLPFIIRVLSNSYRTVAASDGICYVYGEPYEVEGTDGATILTLADDTERVWVQFPIEPGSGSSASIQYGTSVDLLAVDKNQWGFRVLAHITIGVEDEISVFSRRWAGGDMYFSD